MSTHDLFQKYFGNTTAVNMKHPNMENFFEELNAECLAEDKQKNCNIPVVVNLGCDCKNNQYHSDNNEWCYKEQKRIKQPKQPCL